MVTFYLLCRMEAYFVRIIQIILLSRTYFGTYSVSEIHLSDKNYPSFLHDLVYDKELFYFLHIAFDWVSLEIFDIL